MMFNFMMKFYKKPDPRTTSGKEYNEAKKKTLALANQFAEMYTAFDQTKENVEFFKRVVQLTLNQVNQLHTSELCSEADVHAHTNARRDIRLINYVVCELTGVENNRVDQLNYFSKKPADAADMIPFDFKVRVYHTCKNGYLRPLVELNNIAEIPESSLSVVKKLAEMSASAKIFKSVMYYEAWLVWDLIKYIGLEEVVRNYASYDPCIRFSITRAEKGAKANLDWSEVSLLLGGREQCKLASIAANFIDNDYLCEERFYRKNSCLINVFLENFHDRLKADPRYKSDDLSHEAIYQLCTGIELLPEMDAGLRLIDLIAVLSKYRICCTVSDMFNNLVFKFEPKCSKSLWFTGARLRLVVHDNHVWNVNKNIPSFDRVLRKPDPGIMDKPLEKVAIDQEQSIAMGSKWTRMRLQTDLPKIIGCWSDIQSIVPDAKHSAHAEHGAVIGNEKLLYNGGDLRKLMLDFIMNGFEPNSIVRSVSGIDSFRIYSEGTLYDISLPFTNAVTNGHDNSAVNMVMNAEHQVKINNHIVMLTEHFMPKVALSTYTTETFSLFSGRGAKVGYFDNVTPATKCLEVDITRAYTYAMMQIEMIPKLSAFDVLREYDDSEIYPYRFYMASANQDAFLFDKRKNFVSGFVILYARSKGIKVYISHMLIPSETISCSGKDAISAVYSDPDISDSCAKQTCNIVYGLSTKKKRKAYCGSMFRDLAEARSYAGLGCGIETIQVTADDTRYVAWKQSKSVLREGYLPLSHLILDLHRIYMHKIHSAISDICVGVRVDALYVDVNHSTQAIERLKQHGFMFAQTSFATNPNEACKSFDNIGKLRTATKTLKSLGERPLINKSLGERTEYAPNSHYKFSPVYMEDERSVEEFDRLVEDHKRVLMLGHYPGVGKSYAAVDYAKRHGLKLLGITATNAQRDKLIKRDGVDAVTLHTLVGENPNDTGPTVNIRKKTELDVSQYDCFLFEECMLHAPSMMNWIKRFVCHTKRNSCRMFFNGDVHQLNPIYMNLSPGVKYSDFIEMALSQICTLVIMLKEIKRVSDPVEREKIKKLIDTLDSLENKPEQLKKFVGTLPQIKLEEMPPEAANYPQICAKRGTVARINAWSHSIICPGEAIDTFKAGQVVLGASSVLDNAGNIASNQEFVVKTVGLTHITITDLHGKDRTLTIAKSRSALKRPYALTTHSIQGATLECPVLYVHDAYTHMASYEWLRTAFSRGINANVTIVTGSEGVRIKESECLDRIYNHRCDDHKKGRVYCEANYVDYNWVKTQVEKQQYRCRGCGTPIDEKWSIDRISNALPHIKSNCFLSCTKCQCASANRV
jgi:hypothetical protein